MANDADSDRSPWGRPSFVVAAALLAAIVVLGVWLIVDDRSTPRQPGATATASPPASASAGRERAVSDSVCGLPPGDQTIPSRPPRAEWVLRGKLAVPTAGDTIGPRTRADETIPSCFAHSPTGALFASVHIFAALAQLADRPGRYRIDDAVKMLAAGPGRDALEHAARTYPNASGSDSSSGVQIAGFNVVRADHDDVSVDLALRVARPAAAPAYAHLLASMRWEDGDWKLVPTQSGQPFDATQQIPGLDGYVPWSGV